MNIFKTSEDPVECARVLADQHVIKMAVETAQILATALRLHGVEDENLYRATHKGHPCVLWVSSCRPASEWAFNHGLALCHEYQSRFLKEHGALRQFQVIAIHGFDVIPNIAMVEAPKCVPEDLRDIPLHDAYRVTLQRKYATWKRAPRWTRSSRPEWVESSA